MWQSPMAPPSGPNSRTLKALSGWGAQQGSLDACDQGQALPCGMLGSEGSNPTGSWEPGGSELW